MGCFIFGLLTVEELLYLSQCDLEEKDACDAGCNGGLMTNAYKYVEESGGLELESDYPYTGRDGKCGFNSNKVAAKVSNFTNIPIDEDQVAAYLVSSGPLASKFLVTRMLFCVHRDVSSNWKITVLS